jgi:hypothetical protein
MRQEDTVSGVDLLVHCFLELMKTAVRHQGHSKRTSNHQHKAHIFGGRGRSATDQGPDSILKKLPAQFLFYLLDEIPMQQMSS